MNIFLVEGEHPSIPGNPVSVHATPESAAAKALELVNIIREEPLYDPVTGDYSLILPPLPPGSDWKEGLREWQRAKIADNYEPSEIAAMNDDLLADATEVTVWITELELQGAAPAGCDDPALVGLGDVLTLAEAEAEIGLPKAPVRVAVGVQGGQIQWALADGHGASVHIIDYDVEGCTGFDYTLVTDERGDQSPANVYEERIEIDPLYFQRLDTSPTHVNGAGDFYGDDEEDQESDGSKWLVSADLGLPGPDGGFDAYSGWVPGATAEDASHVAIQIIERRYPEGVSIFRMHSHPPCEDRR